MFLEKKKGGHEREARLLHRPFTQIAKLAHNDKKKMIQMTVLKNDDVGPGGL